MYYSFNNIKYKECFLSFLLKYQWESSLHTHRPAQPPDLQNHLTSRTNWSAEPPESAEPPDQPAHLTWRTTWPEEPPDRKNHLTCRPTWPEEPTDLKNHLTCRPTWRVEPPDLKNHLTCRTSWALEPPAQVAKLPFHDSSQPVFENLNLGGLDHSLVSEWCYASIQRLLLTSPLRSYSNQTRSSRCTRSVFCLSK